MMISMNTMIFGNPRETSPHTRTGLRVDPVISLRLSDRRQRRDASRTFSFRRTQPVSDQASINAA